MEKTHRNKVLRKYKKSLNGKRLVCLDIPEDYSYMDPALVRIFALFGSRCHQLSREA
jgi:predicted protein tyrosine phosphatase